MAQHNTLGKAGEQAACEFLIAQGLTVRERNWRMNHLEIDIVAHDPARNVLHIVEVKTRSSDAHFDPMRAVNARKQQHLVDAANVYLRACRMQAGIIFDVLLVVGSEGNFRINYIPNAFVPRLKTYR